nr:subclass B3 metallo-beta-lactamase [Foetidibacter luteolus]
MLKTSITSILCTLVLLITAPAIAQQVREPKVTKQEWLKPYPPFRIAGNLYYVGTYDLACYLIVTAKGNILINTGVASSAAQIKSSIEQLGFRLADTKILLTTQAHFDHLGAMAAIKKMTGAEMMVDEKDADVLRDGGKSDYEMGGDASAFEPVQPARLLRDGDTIALDNMKLVILHHPGHTKGSCSYLFTVNDEQQAYKVLIANMPSIITERPFAEVTSYPGIAEDYARIHVKGYEGHFF